MSSLLARIMLAIFMLPAAAMIMLIAYAAGYEFVDAYPYNNRWAWIFTAAVTWVFVGIYWMLLWHKTVRWTARRKRATLWACAGSAIGGGLVGAAMRLIDVDLGFFTFASVTPLLWLPLTVFIWRESAEERAQRVSGKAAITCPTCGYNLTGLTSTRCPECGTTLTLDQLMSRQGSAQSFE